MPIFQKFIVQNYLEYFKQFKKEINQIQYEIATTDTEIDKMVYGLSDEEVKIVEGANK